MNFQCNNKDISTQQTTITQKEQKDNLALETLNIKECTGMVEEATDFSTSFGIDKSIITDKKLVIVDAANEMLETGWGGLNKAITD